jgi:hypothetical protein
LGWPRRIPGANPSEIGEPADVSEQHRGALFLAERELFGLLAIDDVERDAARCGSRYRYWS